MGNESPARVSEQKAFNFFPAGLPPANKVEFSSKHSQPGANLFLAQSLRDLTVLCYAEIYRRNHLATQSIKTFILTD